MAKHVSASGNVGQLISCKRYILGFIGSSRNCRYIPRTGGKNCHCLPCSKLGPVRHWIGIHWFSEGQLLCTADVLALYILINCISEFQPHQRRSIPGKTWAVYLGECLQPAQEHHVVDYPRRNGKSGSNWYCFSARLSPPS